MIKKITVQKLIIIFFALISILITHDCSCFAQPQEHYLTILHTNDVHGRLEPFQYRNLKNLSGGIAGRAALIKDIKNTNKYVLTVDAGDIAQGTLFFKFFNGIPDMQLMSDIGYDVAAPGNHEFDKGLDVFGQMTNAAKFPFVCANISFKDNKNIKFDKYVIKDFGNFKIGVIGIIAENLKVMTLLGDSVKVSDPVKELKKIIGKIKLEVDLIVVLSHQGVENDIRLAKAVPEINVIIGGHSHTLLTKPVIIRHGNNKTIIVQSGEQGIYLGRIDLKFSSKKLNSYEYKLIPVDENVKEDEIISRQVNELSSTVHALTAEIVGTVEFPIDSKSSGFLSTIGLLVNEAISKNYPDADIVIQNNGGIRVKRYISPGNVTKADILEIFPFENKSVMAQLKGKEIKSMLESSSAYLPEVKDSFLQTKGINYTVDLSKNPQIMSSDGTKILKKGNRVRDIFINGQPLNPEKYYKIIANDFLFSGGDGYVQLKHARNTVFSEVYIQDLITNYIKNNSPLNLKIQDKINVIKGNNNIREIKVISKERLLYGT
ncbi:MAG: bifunctional UDP-sugar hydrolase/5'-nucleotidase [Candidatus Gastranaerophilales bacterium]|nr:bifunctional UDP-sugar hydrolase/5'-nucleotidase [Candidatus Gastranaerophilales bacterium]